MFHSGLAQWSTIGLGKESNGLYLLQDLDSRTTTSALVVVVSHISLSNLWHHRLGYPSYSKLHLLKQVVQFDVSNKTPCCDVCHFSKQKRLPFTSTTHISSKPFELYHCDLWGPFATSTIDGFKYFLTIVDDFTRCTWVYLLKYKFETQIFLPQFATVVNTQFNSKIKIIRSDNGTKFYLKDFFHSNGILH